MDEDQNVNFTTPLENFKGAGNEIVWVFEGTPKRAEDYEGVENFQNSET